MVRTRLNSWSGDRHPEDNAFALLALGLVPARLRNPQATAPEILSALRECLAEEGQPARWLLNAAHGKVEGWETIVPIEDLAAVVREALPNARNVHIECGDALDPEDVLDFFAREFDCSVLRANGWTFTAMCDEPKGRG
jgi:hypothetical protein